MVTVTAWQRTGFSPVDLPKDRSVLEVHPELCVWLAEPVDLCQIYNLSEIRLKGTETESANIDYIELARGNERAYYVVAGPPVMTSGNVVSLPVVPDPFMTAGEASNLQVKGHVIRNTRNGVYRGRNTLLDPLMIPSYPCLRKFKGAFNEVGNGGSTSDAGYYHVIASSVQLPYDVSFNPNDLYQIDFNTGKVSASWLPEAVGQYGTTVEIHLQINAADEPTVFSSKTSGYALYLNNAQVDKYLQALWGIGGQGAILGSYKIPVSLFEIETASGSSRITKITMKSQQVNFGQEFQQPSKLYEDYNGPDKALVKNNADLITFSDQYRIGIISTISGSRQVSKGYSTTGTVICVADPRLNGKPYFILPDAVKDAATDVDDYNIAQLFSRGIPGGEWESVPLSYSGAMGWASQQATMVNRDDMAAKRNSYANEFEMYTAAGSVMTAGLSAATGNINWENNDYIQSKRAIGRGAKNYIDSITPIPEQGGFVSQALGIVGNGIGSVARTLGVSDEYLTPISSESRNNVIRQQESERAKSQYMIDYKFVAPTTTAIPATTWQGCVGNGVIIYVEYPDPEDVKKWARMVDYFGAVADDYPDIINNIGTPPRLEQVRCFIQAVGTVIHNSAEAAPPASVLRDCEAALAVGVRFWSQIPLDSR